jgi:anti-sigma regulatory factor (Ser/Thr protein kinase)
MVPESPTTTPRRSLHVAAAELTDLASIRGFLEAAATDLGADALAIRDLVIAANEAVANIIRHGYRGTPGPIEVIVEREPGSIVVRLRDEAAVFDPTTYPRPDLAALEERRAGGLGIHLTQTSVDEVTHLPLHGSGNELTLVKRLGAGERGATG